MFVTPLALARHHHIEHCTQSAPKFVELFLKLISGMNALENRDEIPDLSGQIKLLSFKPVYNGSYSSVLRGILGNELVRNFAVCNYLASLRYSEQVAIKVLKEPHGVRSDSMDRVSGMTYSVHAINIVISETSTRTNVLGTHATSQCTAAVRFRQ